MPPFLRIRGSLSQESSILEPCVKAIRWEASGRKCDAFPSFSEYGDTYQGGMRVVPDGLGFGCDERVRVQKIIEGENKVGVWIHVTIGV